MACIELHINGRTFRLTDGAQSEVVSTSDWDIVLNLINRKTLPEGFSLSEVIKGKEEKIEDLNLLVDYIMDISEEDVSNNTLLKMLQTNKITKSDFINKVIGNETFSGTLSKHKHIQNALYLKDVGGYRWYGFTSNRMMIITGSKFAERGDKILIDAYDILKNDETSFIAEIINDLYKQHSKKKLNIYEKFTWLANNDRIKLISSLSLPLSQAIFDKSTSKTIIRNLIKNHVSNYIGKIVFFNDMPHIIQGKYSENELSIIDLNTNKTVLMPLKNVSNVYNTFGVNNNQGEFILLKGIWYKTTKQGVEIVSNELSNELFKTHFGLSNTSIRIKPNVTKEYNINGVTLDKVLPNGSKVYTTNGVYTKNDGEFKRKNEILNSNDIIFKIDTSENDLNIYSELIDFSPEVPKVSTNQMKVLMYELYGFEDFDNIKINYGKHLRPFRVNKIAGTTDVIISMQGVTNEEITIRQLKYMEAAIKYYKYIMNSQHVGEEISNVNLYWPKIERILEGFTVKDDVVNTWVRENLNDVHEDMIVEVENKLKNKIDTFRSTIANESKKVDKLFDELMSCGIIEWSCSYGLSD